jgi:hypothetical protein
MLAVGCFMVFDMEHRNVQNKLKNLGLNTYTMEGTEGTACLNVVTNLSESANKYAPEGN